MCSPPWLWPPPSHLCVLLAPLPSHSSRVTIPQFITAQHLRYRLFPPALEQAAWPNAPKILLG